MAFDSEALHDIDEGLSAGNCRRRSRDPLGELPLDPTGRIDPQNELREDHLELFVGSVEAGDKLADRHRSRCALLEVEGADQRQRLRRADAGIGEEFADQLRRHRGPAPPHNLAAGGGLPAVTDRRQPSGEAAVPEARVSQALGRDAEPLELPAIAGRVPLGELGPDGIGPWPSDATQPHRHLAADHRRGIGREFFKRAKRVDVGHTGQPQADDPMVLILRPQQLRHGRGPLPGKPPQRPGQTGGMAAVIGAIEGRCEGLGSRFGLLREPRKSGGSRGEIGAGQRRDSASD